MTGAASRVVLGAGPIGLAVARHLADAGHEVTLVTRQGRPTGIAGVRSRAADLTDRAAAIAACAGAATVFHCAAPPYHRWPEEFPALQENILQASARAGAVLVVVENLYGYGVAGTLTEDLPLAATTRKGRVRADLTRRLFAAHAAGEVRAVVGRASDFVGAGVTASSLGDRVWPRLLSGKPVDWFGDPDAVHSFTHVPDLACALVRLASGETAWGRAWHVPSPRPRTPRDILAEAAELAGVPVPKLRQTPVWLLRAAGVFVPAARELPEMSYSFAQPFIMDHAAYDAAFGDTATPWRDVLSATLDWWRSRPPR